MVVLPRASETLDLEAVGGWRGLAAHAEWIGLCYVKVVGTDRGKKKH